MADMTPQEAIEKIKHVIANMDDRLIWTIEALNTAIAALEATVPRVLGLEELHEMSINDPRRPIFVEKLSQFHYGYYTSARTLSMFVPGGQGSAVYNTIVEPDWCWRAWTIEPTAEQMSATPWTEKQEG